MSIVLFCPYTDYHHFQHRQSICELYALEKEKHGLVQHFTHNKKLHEAQAEAVGVARKVGASHILFTEHDHWMYPTNGIDTLLNADKDVIGFKTYSRKYPYGSFFLKRMNKEAPLLLPKPKRLLTKAEREFYLKMSVEGAKDVISKVDVLSWAFTLVRTDVFDRIEDPFMGDPHNPTDSCFAHACEQAGIDRWGHFGATINHGEFGVEEIPYRRRLHQELTGKPPLELATDQSRSQRVGRDADVGTNRSEGAIAAG